MLVIARVVLLSAIAITLAILRWVPRPNNTYFWLEVYNWGHIWLFATVTLIFVWCFDQLRSSMRFSKLLLISAALMIVLAAISELLQIGAVGRNADPNDFGRDVTGIIIAITGLAIWHQRRRGKQLNWRYVGPSLAAGTLILAAASWPVVSMLQAYNQREPALPVLFSPDLGWSRSFVRNVRSQLSYGRPPAGFDSFAGQYCLHVTTKPRRYSGAEFPDLHANWTGYGTLRVELFSGSKTSLPILIRLDASSYPYSSNDWANIDVRLEPGSNLVEIDLDQLKNAGTGAEFDRSHVYNIVIATFNQRQRHNLCFGKIILIGRAI